MKLTKVSLNLKNETRTLRCGLFRKSELIYKMMYPLW